MRSIAPLALAALALTGCFEEEAPPPPPPVAKTEPEPAKTAKTVAEDEPDDPAPVRPLSDPTPATSDPEPEPKPTKAPKKPRKPMNLLSRTKVELETVDEAALKKAPRKVENRTKAAERKARATSGKSAWKPRKKGSTRSKPLPAVRGPLKKVRPSGVGREILRTWNAAQRLMRSSSYGSYLKLHTPDVQRTMVAYGIRVLFARVLQNMNEFAVRNMEPPKYKQVRERLQKYGVRRRTLKLKRVGSGRQITFEPPDPATVVAQIRNLNACYVELMKLRDVRTTPGTHHGVYMAGTLAGLVVQGNRASASVIESNGKVRVDILFQRDGRDWKMASRNNTRYRR